MNKFLFWSEKLAVPVWVVQCSRSTRPTVYLEFIGNTDWVTACEVLLFLLIFLNFNKSNLDLTDQCGNVIVRCSKRNEFYL